MQELHLVGFTTDRRSLILSTRQGAESGSFVVPVDEDLLAAVARLLDDGPRPGGADDTDDDPDGDTDGDPVDDTVEPPAPEPRTEAKLAVREVQARLRSGESIDDIAADAGVEPAWVERFAPPVWAEQQQVVTKALATPLERPRQGRSAVALREAVARAMAERDISLTAQAFSAAWRSRLVGSDLWAVEFHFRHRGRDRTASWTFDAADQRLTTSDRFASQIGFVPGADDDAAGADHRWAAQGQVTPTPEQPATRKPATKKPATRKPARKQPKAKKQPATRKPARKQPKARKQAPKKQPAAKESATVEEERRAAEAATRAEAEAEAERDRAAAAAVAAAERKIAEEREAEEERRAAEERAVAEQAAAASPPAPTALVARLRAPDEKADTDDLNGRTAARRARTAARTVPTAQFRSGAAVPAADAPGKVNGARREPVGAEPSDPEADARRTGGRRPRRTRQLRAR